ncbi:Uncharacterised protein [Vibrio cholerae]|nr:Uncharacterised protein [Vibrio cholerae]CSC40983.1 Uncharacterised protein [Vibrio cholerae]
MPKTNVGQSNIHQGLQLTCYHRYGVKKLACVFNGHVQNFINRLAFVAHFQCFSVIAFTFTHITRHIHIG